MDAGADFGRFHRDNAAAAVELGGPKFLFSAGRLPHTDESMTKLFDLTGEVAVVIGATGVLGGALAEGLGEAGAKVAVLGRNEERGVARAKAIKAEGGHAEL